MTPASLGLLDRRQWLRASLAGLGGLTLAQPLVGATVKKDTAIILVFLHGGPSHLETYDMKPNASDQIRGPFKPIRTSVPGIDICEHLPRQAKIAHRFTLLRSCSHDEADHFAGHRRFLSGYGKLKAGTGYESHYPQVGAVVNRLLKGRDTGTPSALAVGGVVVNGPDYAAGISEGYWSGTYRVPIVNGGLRDTHPRVSAARLQNRLAMQKTFDNLKRAADSRESMKVTDAFQQKALALMASGKVQRAFDVSQESPRLREKYGPGYGHELLIARRLVEAGVRFVSVRVPGSGPGTKAYDWDDHAVNWDMKTAMLARLPRYDQVLTTFIDDIFDRGLNKNVLVIATGEFGRTPRLENKDGKIGRDHWPSAMSILFSGGGLPMGKVIGSTTSGGEEPKENRVDPRDLLATMYHHLGIDHTKQINDPTGRPVELSQGKVIDFTG